MRKEEVDNEKVAESHDVAPAKTAMKHVRNRGSQRIELPYGDKVFVFLPGETYEVPEEFSIPSGLGLAVI